MEGMEAPTLSKEEEAKINKKIEEQLEEPKLSDLELLKREMQRIIDKLA